MADLYSLQAEKTESGQSKYSAIGVPWIRRRPFCDPENFSSGYIMRSEDILFKQGSGEPRSHMLEYHQERETLPNADLDDGSLVYS
jgi:hypothetical protein